MDFGANKTLVEIIREGALGGTYFGDIYSSVNGKWFKKSWKELLKELVKIKRIKELVIKYSSEVLLCKLLWCQCQ